MKLDYLQTFKIETVRAASSFFPMPTVMVGTLDDSGHTSFGSYSLMAPYYIAGKEYYTMLLSCRNSSNTAKGLLRTGKCTLNFIPDNRKYFKEAVRMVFPGDTPEEKMKGCIFTLEEGHMSREHPDEKLPKVIIEAFQTFECTWMSELDGAQNDRVQEEYEGPYHDFNGITSKFGAHFILRIDKILMKEKYYNAIINGVRGKDFPPVPVDYGYRDSRHFWLSRFRKPVSEPLPQREVDIASVKYATDRIDDKIRFTDEACASLVKVPRIFLTTALRGCVEWARQNNVTLITAEHMKSINDKRGIEKK